MTYQYETFETVGGTKKSSKYRCETCNFNKPLSETEKYCSKASEINVIFMPEDDSNMYLGCASHSDFQSEREKVLEALKKDLQTRFISSSNQWSKGRNSGLLECCNIIDEKLRQGKVEK